MAIGKLWPCPRWRESGPRRARRLKAAELPPRSVGLVGIRSQETPFSIFPKLEGTKGRLSPGTRQGRTPLSTTAMIKQ